MRVSELPPMPGIEPPRGPAPAPGGFGSDAAGEEDDDRALVETARGGLGEWVRTDESSRARLEHDIGFVEVRESSRLRLAESGRATQRMELPRGEIHAFVTSEPRLFMVDTPAARAVDMGCSYTLAVDEDGRGELRVESGLVVLERDGAAPVRVPAGTVCRIYGGAGPGTPVREGAPAALAAAVERYDDARLLGASGKVKVPETAAEEAAAALLDVAGADDAITLWHVLLTAPASRAGGVYERLAAAAAPPPGVSREGVVGRAPGDAARSAAMEQWWEAIRGSP